MHQRFFSLDSQRQQCEQSDMLGFAEPVGALLLHLFYCNAMI